MNNKEAQQLLIKQRLLDPPADGAWGKQSIAALRDFQLNNNLPIGGLDDKTKAVLRAAPEPFIDFNFNLAAKITQYMINQSYWVPVGERRYSIVYVEGMSPDGTLNNDNPNEWNDSRFVIEIKNFKPRFAGAWRATTEPGDHYTYYPMNSGGAFRIKFGQYKAWQVGTHGNSEPHESLVQVGLIGGHRDFNQDFMRTGDEQVEGLYGVNQHWGYDLPKVGVASAGCLVGQSRDGHEEFMRVIKNDRRYQANAAYTFYTAIIPGDKL